MSRPDQRSPQADAYRRLYRTSRWLKLRAAQLQAEPFCQACRKLGRITPATVCNHIDKTAKATVEGFYRGPFSSLCAPCHDAGQQKAERAGFTGEADADGWPTDPKHLANRLR